MIMKYKVVTRWTYAGPQREKFMLPSLTIPDQTLSLKDLISRYVRGQEIPTFTPQFDVDDEVVPVNLEKMTPQDRLDLARAVRKEIKEKREAMAKAAPPSGELPGSAAVEDVEGI